MITRIKLGQAVIDEISESIIIFPNRTHKYLLPCLKEYGEEFMNKLNSVFKIAAGIGDVVVENTGINYGLHIFLQLETSIGEQFFIDFLAWIREQPMYEQDYVFGNIQTSSEHMVVLKFPENHARAFREFKEGSYSKMFTPFDAERIFKFYPHTQKVLLKDKGYTVRFIKKVNLVHGTTIKPEEGWEGEFDFKPEPEEEIFNHNLKLNTDDTGNIG